MKRLALGAVALALATACSPDSTSESHAAAPATSQSPSAATLRVASAGVSVNDVASPFCPPYSFPDTINLAVNPSFETGPGPQTWPPGPTPPPSAASSWFMHTDNFSALVKSNLVTTNVPGPGGSRMLHFVAGGAEGGVYQQLAASPANLMFSAWVRVKRGHVVLQADGSTTGPSAWSTKTASRLMPTGEWEQLRVCTNGAAPTGYFILWNEDPTGGEFWVDRVEIRQMY
jgi:hypothetical protein